MLHVREVITDLNYEQLVGDGLIPDAKPYISANAKVSKRFPYWVYKDLKPILGDKTFSFFGYYMDYMVRKMISDEIPVIWNQHPSPEDNLLTNFLSKTKKWNNVAFPTLQLTAIHMGFNPNLLNIDTPRFNKTYGFLGTVAKSVKTMFVNSSNSQVEFDSEFIIPTSSSSASGIQEAEINIQEADIGIQEAEIGIQGHPDIITLNAVIDIKTTQNFMKMADESLLQIYSYVAIMRHLGRIVDYMGILLPMQQTLVLFDIRQWDAKPFLEKLLQTVRDKCQNHTSLYNLEEFAHMASCISSVGQTISRNICIGGKRKTVSISQALSNYISRSIDPVNNNLNPVQIFYHGNRVLNLKITDAIIAETANLVYNYGLRLYIHAPYTINFSKPATNRDPNDDQFVITMSKRHMEVSSSIGCKGVVFHVGKAIGMTYEQGIDRMEQSIRQVLESVNESTPFLLETPVGAGNEVLWRIQEFMDFYDRFTPEEHRKFKVCIDTCHVWCAGYEPIYYLKQWESRHGSESIGLIHFNDSRKHKGGRADGHARCGTGNIGLVKMSEIAAWCKTRNLDMVFE